MKYLAGTIACILIVAGATGFGFYRLSADPAAHAAAARRDAMQWLRAEFHLTDAQFAAIVKLHAAYAPSCAEHCRRIQEVSRTLASAVGTDPVARAAAEQKLHELQRVCETALTRHVRDVAALMSPDDGRRYLALMLPRIRNFDHRAVPDLRLDHS